MNRISVINNRLTILKNRQNIIKNKLKDCEHMKSNVFDVIMEEKEKECIVLDKEFKLIKSEIDYLIEKKIL